MKDVVDECLTALGSQQLRVLVVDACRLTQATFTDALNQVGHNTLIAENGAEAKKAIGEFRPDVVLLDVHLPDMAGFDLLKSIRRQPELKHTGVIIATADDDPNLPGVAFESGADDVITKPVDSRVLLARLRHMANGRNLERCLRSAMRQAEEATNAKSEFLANMSHEIRTPMTAILGYADVILESCKSQTEKSAANVIKRNGEYLIEIINDILDLAKVESGKLELDQSAVSPQAVIEDAYGLMTLRAKAKNIDLSYSVDSTVPTFMQMDGARIKQVLVNLLGNAIKFTNKGSVKIEARTETVQDDQFLVIDVVDTGCGIRDSDIDRLFDPFSQVDSSATRRFAGTGLGLAICNRLTGLMGGAISVKSEFGVGSRFSFQIPIDVSLDIESVRNRQAIEEREHSTSRDVGRLDCRILVAEDGVDNQRLIQHILKKAGADVTIVENGALAVSHVMDEPESEPFQLIIMDMQMPVMDGYSAATELRARGCRLPILALTAHAMTGDRRECLNAGCDDYMTKPINRSELLSRLASLLAQQSEIRFPAKSS